MVTLSPVKVDFPWVAVTLGTTLEITAHTPFNFVAFDKLFNKLQLPQHSLTTDIRALNDALRKYLQRFESHIQALRGTQFIDLDTPEIIELIEVLLEDDSLENFLNNREFEVDNTIVRLNKDLFNDFRTISRVNILHGHTGNNGAKIEDEDGALSEDFIEYSSHKEKSHLLMREIFFNNCSLALFNCDLTVGQPYLNEAAQIAGHIEGHVPCRQRSLNTFYKLEDEFQLRNATTEIDRTIESSPEYLLSTEGSESRMSEMIENSSDSDDEAASEEEGNVNSYDAGFFSTRNDAANLSCCFLSCVPPL